MNVICDYANCRAALIASLTAVLHRYTEASDILIGCVLETERGARFASVPIQAQMARSAKDWIQHAAERIEVETGEPVSAVTSFRISLDFLRGGDFADELTRRDLVLTMQGTDSALEIHCEYDSEFFHPSTIERFLEHWKTIFNSMTSSPEVPVATLPMLSRDELHRVLSEWNATTTPFRNSCIHQLFEEQTRRDPARTAVIFGDRRRTYEQVNSRANQLARKLRMLGVGPEVLVGICAEPSLDMIVGLLAILKSGGAYVPLDPNYPHERMAFMIQDADLQVILTQDRLRTAFTEHSSHIICIDSALMDESGSNLPCNTHPRNLAYVIYTSGSTGTPQGVMITHRNVSNFFAGMDERLGVEPGVWLAATRISFDISVLELFWTLSRGFTVVIADGDQSGAQGDRNLAVLAQRHGVTHFQCTPSVAGALAVQPENHDWFRKLRHFVMGGEALPASLAARLRELVGGRLHNMYGPTEATVCSTTQVIDGVRQPIAIGRPIANTTVYLLDAFGQPVPFGLPGELCIGGAGVSRGYWRRPELTARKFIPDRFSDGPDARLYCTGDRARYREDGALEFLGRIDSQVKIGRHRVELAEIESALDQRLPRTPSGKIDRRNLPSDIPPEARALAG